MEDLNEELASFTIRCFLCKGFVLYKDGDLSRFRAHLANQHGVFFDVEYLLASCFMDDDQKQAIAQPVLESLKRENSPTSLQEDTQVKSVVKKEKSSKAKSKKLEKAKVKKEKSSKSKKTEKKTAEPDGGKPDAGEGNVDEETATAPGPEISLKEEVDMSFSSAADSLLDELRLETLDSSLDVTVDENDQSFENVEESGAEKVKEEDCEQLGSKKKGRKKSEAGSDGRWRRLTESLAKQGVDITQSAYFSRTKQVLCDGEKYIDKFTETAPGLPENWRFRAVDAKDKGKVVVHKHFLSPEGALMKSTMAVVEYLRIQGKLKSDEILEIAKSLKVGNRKLQKLFANDATEEA